MRLVNLYGPVPIGLSDRSSVVSADAGIAIRSVDSTLRQANVLIGRLDGIAADIKGGNGAVSKLIYDKNFADELERTVKSAQSLIESIERSGIKAKLNIGFGK